MICYIIDDELHAIDTLSGYISRSPDVKLAGSDTNPIKGLQFIKNEQSIDVVFLDVDMPIISGLEIATLLPVGVSVVFTTGFSHYALNAFEVNAVDFLLKPFSYAKFLTSLEKVAAARKTVLKNSILEPSSMFINPGVKGKVLQIHFPDILYVEALKNYVMIYTKNGRHITYLTMNEVLLALPVKSFVRVHKSFIVNLREVRSIDGNTIIVTEDIQLPLGISYKDQVMDIVASLTVRSSRNS